jgi:hypothetical protein
MPHRQKWIDQMTPDERAAYLERQPKKVQSEIARLERQIRELRAQLEAVAPEPENQESAPVTWHVPGVPGAPESALHGLPERAHVTFHLGGGRLLEICHREGRIRVTNLLRGELVLRATASNSYDFEVIEPRQDRKRAAAALRLSSAALALAGAVRAQGQQSYKIGGLAEVEGALSDFGAVWPEAQDAQG